MKLRQPVITENGIIIDPDDDAIIIKHSNVYEFVHDKHCSYSKRIYPYSY